MELRKKFKNKNQSEDEKASIYEIITLQTQLMIANYRPIKSFLWQAE